MGHSVHNLLTPSVHNLMTLTVHEVLTLYRAVSSTDRCGYRVPGVVFGHSLVDGPRSVYVWIAFTWKE